MVVTKNQKKKIAAWQEAKSKLDTYKYLESSLRDELTDLIFKEQQEGTSKVSIGAGYELVCKQGYQRKVDPDDLKEVLKQFPRSFKKKVIKTSVSLISAGYKKLTDEEKDMFDECLTLVPSKPQLSIKVPKKEKQ